MKRCDLSQDQIKSELTYNPNTGIFTWNKTNKYRSKGDIAGKNTRLGYITISIFSKTYFAHRLAWVYIHGVWPIEELDHKNINGRDNRICNLREATVSQNKANYKKRKDNKSGYKGVGWQKSQKKWRARICTRDGRLNLG